MRIVVADDDPLARQLTGRILTRAGYEVQAVEDGLAAVELLTSKNPPRLALLDWSMPGLDGPDVCRKLRSLTDNPYVYLILLTSRESKEDTVSGLEAGADDYLTKPCDGEELKARLRAGIRILDLQDRLFHEARHDPLTQLPNRAAFIRRLTDCFERAKATHDCRFAVLFVDLDRFKHVNDTLGHAVGDQLLVQVAKRLAGSVRRDDAVSRGVACNGPRRLPDEVSVARMGGDEFTILLDEISGPAQAELVAQRIRDQLSAPYQIGDHRLEISASVGVAVSGPAYATAEDLLRAADTAMYAAKNG